MAIPIILIHRSNSNYLPYTIAQAKWTNPRSSLFLIGDESNRYDVVEHELISNYMGSAAEFADVYQHLSVNPVKYELFCFQRWFILKDFMSQHALDQCFYLDSDVLLYDDITLDQARLKQYEFALTSHVPSSVFINSFTALEQFCSLVISLYHNADSFEKIESSFKEQLQTTTAAAISDMFAFAEYRKQYPHKVGDLLEISDDSTYDAGMRASDGFEMVNDVKNIHFKHQQPFGNHLDLGKSIRFKVLHFQGISKRYIKDYFTGDRLPNCTSNEPSASLRAQLENQSESKFAQYYAVLQRQPEDPNAHYNVGCALVEQGQLSDAIRYFQAAIELLPTFFNAYINLGAALVQQNQSEEAILFYQTALELQPNSTLAYGNLGYAYGARGQVELSECCIAMCNALETLALRPDWAEVHRNLGLAHQQFGNLNDAIACFQRALDLQPDFLPAQIDLQNALLYQQAQQQSAINLRTINLIIFPDWQQALDILYLDLKSALQAVLTHPQHSEITLLIYAAQPSKAHSVDVEAVLDEVMFNLLMEQSIDVTDPPEICPIGLLSEAQWDSLMPYIKSRIRLNHEDLTTTPKSISQHLISVELNVQGSLDL